MRAVFNVDNNFARAVVTELAQGYRAVIKTQKDLQLRSSLERLANFLLRQQKRAGGARSSSWTLKSAGWRPSWG